MKIVITVNPRHEAELREFKAALERKTRPTKGIPKVTMQVQRSGIVSELSLHRFNVEITDLPEPRIEVGDVVRIEASGNWGKVLSVRGTKITIKASRESRQETGQETFVCHSGDVEVLV